MKVEKIVSAELLRLLEVFEPQIEAVGGKYANQVAHSLNGSYRLLGMKLTDDAWWAIRITLIQVALDFVGQDRDVDLHSVLVSRTDEVPLVVTRQKWMGPSGGWGSYFPIAEVIGSQ